MRRKRLPKDFEVLLEKGSVAKLKAVFDVCDVDARGGFEKQSALAFAACPDELTRWLVAQGADLAARDRFERTPLHARAGAANANLKLLLRLGADVHARGIDRGTPLHDAADACQAAHARTLLQAGADVHARASYYGTPLESALLRASYIRLPAVLALARVLVNGGARTTPAAKASIAKLGHEFEFRRSDLPASVTGPASAALRKLCQMFGVTPEPQRATHDGRTPIMIKARGWRAAHEELWQRLIPSTGAAATVQGEGIRIAGKLAHELGTNRGCHWDSNFAAMAKAWLAHVANGTPLAGDAAGDAATVVASILGRRAADTDRLMELGVAWVRANPIPIRLPKPRYAR